MNIAILVEGMDCSGKTTFIQALYNAIFQTSLPKPRILLPLCDGPKKSWMRKELLESDRGYSRTVKAAVFTFDRTHMIAEALEQNPDNTTFIIDRWVASTLAYNCDIPGVYTPNKFLSDMVVLQVFLEVDKEVLLARLLKKHNKDEHENDLEYLSETMDRYDEALTRVEDDLGLVSTMRLPNNLESDLQDNVLKVVNTLKKLQSTI